MSCYRLAGEQSAQIQSTRSRLRRIGLPKSKSKSKRQRYQPPPKPKPPPSPPWVPILFLAGVGAGLAIILARLLFAATFPILDHNAFLIIGLTLVFGALGAATRWH